MEPVVTIWVEQHQLDMVKPRHVMKIASTDSSMREGDVVRISVPNGDWVDVRVKRATPQENGTVVYYLMRPQDVARPTKSKLVGADPISIDESNTALAILLGGGEKSRN